MKLLEIERFRLYVYSMFQWGYVRAFDDPSVWTIALGPFELLVDPKDGRRESNE